MQTQGAETPQPEGVSVKEQVNRLLIEEPELTKAQIARETGISASTLTEYLKGTYRGNIASVETKLVRYLRARRSRDREKLVAVDRADFFEGDSSSWMLEVYERAQGLGMLGLIAAAPGLGKTTTAREYQRLSSNVWIATCAPFTQGDNPALKVLMDAVGASTVGTAGQAYATAIMRKLDRSQGLVIIDEAHHLATKALDSIRCIFDQTNVGIVFVGSIELATKTSKMPQLHSRITFRADITGPTTGDLLALLDAHGITDERMREFIASVARRPGALRSASRLIELARSMAKRATKPMSLRYLELAWSAIAPGAVAESSDKEVA
jgi:hypothetical protein